MEQATLCEPEDVAPPKPDDGCMYWGICQNTTTGGPETTNKMCTPCLDAVRSRGRGLGHTALETENYLREWHSEND